MNTKDKLMCEVCGKKHDSRVRHSPCPQCGEPLLATPGSCIVGDKPYEKVEGLTGCEGNLDNLLSVPYFGGQCKKCGWIYGKQMTKIPLHNLFENALGIGKINNREDFDKLITELEAEDGAKTKREEVRPPLKIPKCSR
jgi:predicted RNA-binding Zn-ribbon protein involved in translation (DUF1610 family)